MHVPQKNKSVVEYLLAGSDDRRQKGNRIRVIIALVTLLPVAMLAAVSFYRISGDVTDATFRKRESAAQLAASTLRSRFDALSGIAETLSESTGVRQSVMDGDWAGAVRASEAVLESDSHVERIGFTDPSGTLMADKPTLPGVVGRNFSDRDWYQGVTRTGRVYVSNAFKRTGEPQINVIVVASPVKGEDGKVLSYMLLSVTVQDLLPQASSIGVGSDTFVYFADRAGNVIGHPRFPADSVLTNMIGYAPVGRALASERGVQIVSDPYLNEDVIAAFEPVVRYGWAAIVEQPTSAAFSARLGSLRMTAYAYGVIFLVNVAMAAFIIKAINTILLMRRREASFIRTFSDAIIVVDRDDIVRRVNPATELLLAMPESELLGRSFAEVIPLRDDQGEPFGIEKDVLRRALVDGRASVRARITARDGRTWPVLASAVTQGVDDSTVVQIRDMTKEDELYRTRKEFISITSHQLLTPVSAAKGFLSLLIAGDLGKISDSQKESLTKLYAINQRMIEIIDDLLNMSRLELGAVETVAEPIDLEAFLRAEAEAIAPLALSKQVAVSQSYGGRMPQFRVPIRLLRIVIQNLLSNAVKYTPAGGSVMLAAEVTEQDGRKMASITVTDTGYGIPEKECDRIFGKFYRADNVRMKGTDGTGLGLYVTKQVVELLKGRIWFDSRENQGTTFHVTLPYEG